MKNPIRKSLSVWVLSLATITTTICASFALWFAGCLVDAKCYQNADCESPKFCDIDGECNFRCVYASDCDAGFLCDDHQCVLDLGGASLQDCPDDMALIQNSFCMDIYEASRPDATETDPGVDETVAVSREGVMPWEPEDNETAQRACEAADKTLCSPNQWEYVCHGPEDTVYPYGNDYDKNACNGIDAFGSGNYHLAPTGSFPDCKNDFGIYDLSGNLWEHISGGNNQKVKGGAYNCGNSAAYHQCDFNPTWEPSAIGFRCCYFETDKRR